MLSSVASFTLEGAQARPVRVEVDIHRGLPAFSIVGLPDVVVREERERVRAALINSGFEFPIRRIVANLAPACSRKQGHTLGLALAVTLLCASGQLNWERLARLALVGELQLSGSLKRIDGALEMAEAAREEGREAIVVPANNGCEARQAGGIEVIALSNLGQLPALAAGEYPKPPPPAVESAGRELPAGTAPPRPGSAPRACPECLRRSHLLAQLAPYIERICSAAPGRRVPELLTLGNEELCAVVAPSQADQLLARAEAISETRLGGLLSAAECWAICRHERGFPEALREVSGAPWALMGRGNPALLEGLVPDDAVTIVGARRATTYGREIARSLARELAEAGIVVVSGLAFGVDACAHRGALDTGRTFAVMGCGPDVAYPAAHRSLWRRICERGLVLSELPPGTGAWRWTFPARNRIMAALGAMTVVVESAERSGSLITAEVAEQLGRKLGAVPGPVTSRTSVGPNSLLARGASVVRGAQDVLDALSAARGVKGGS